LPAIVSVAAIVPLAAIAPLLAIARLAANAAKAPALNKRLRMQNPWSAMPYFTAQTLTWVLSGPTCGGVAASVDCF
jgi:hypothetical protein